VLWLDHYEGRDSHASTREWRIEGGFQALNDCQAAVRRTIEAHIAQQDAGTTVVRNPKSTIEETKALVEGKISGRGAIVDKGMSTIVAVGDMRSERRYLCLPGAVDPRSPAK
jgi:hypothetical protein